MQNNANPGNTAQNFMNLTARQLSIVLGVQPSTITRDIKKGRLSAMKNERGEFEIDPSEIARAYADRITIDAAGNIAATGQMQNDATPLNDHANSSKDLDFLRERLAILEIERD